MISRRFKGVSSRLLRPAALFLQKHHIYPNHLTLMGLMLSMAAGAAFSFGRFRLGGGALILSGLSDVLDGSLARNTGTTSPFGAFIDSVADRYSEFFVFFGLVYWFYRMEETLSLLVILLAMLGSVMVSYTRARSESIIGDCQVGLMERPERLLVLIVFSLMNNIEPALWILAAGANLTALQRILHTYRKTRPES